MSFFKFREIHVCIDDKKLTHKFNTEDKLAKIRKTIVDKKITNEINFVFKWQNGKIVKHEEESNNLARILKDNNKLYISTLQKNSEIIVCINEDKPFNWILSEGSHQDKILISKAKEDEKILLEILKIGDNDRNYLHILRKNEPDWVKLATKCECGFIIEEDSVKQARNRAFIINKREIEKIQDNSGHFIKTLECKNEFQKLCHQNFIKFGNATSILPWASIFFGLEQETLTKKLECYKRTKNYSYVKKRCAMIKITKDNICLTTEFEADVDAALNEKTQDKKVTKLKEITKKYGCFYANTIYFGGVAIQKDEDIKRSDKNENSDKIGIQGSFRSPGANVDGDFTSKTGINTKTATANAESSFIIKGGNGAIFKFNDHCDWINSLLDHNTWDIIEYEEVTPIFDLLGDKLRKRVLETLGKRILKVNIESIDYPINKEPFPYPLGEKLKDITNIEDCEIFVTIMKKKNRHIFSSHIYYDAPDKPVILIQRIPSKRKTKKDYIKIKIGWIIIGYPTKTFDFDLSNQVVLKSERYKLSNENNRYAINNSKQTNLPDIQDMKPYVLATCILDRVEETNSSPEELSECNKKQLHPRDLRLIVGTHFSLSKDFAYEATWNSLGRISINKEKVYCSKIKNKINERLVFAYLLFDKCQLECNNHGVINIANIDPNSSDYLLCRWQNNSSFDKNELLCFYLSPNKEHIHDIDETHKKA
ncbi:1250_t:CDS:2, partial [Racocetra persica]